jgi:hypothetical protein
MISLPPINNHKKKSIISFGDDGSVTAEALGPML